VQDTIQQTVARIRSSGTCILLADAPTVAPHGAPEGRTEPGILANRRGMRVLSTYAPLKLPGLSWVLIAEVEYQEVMAHSRMWATVCFSSGQRHCRVPVARECGRPDDLATACSSDADD